MNLEAFIKYLWQHKETLTNAGIVIYLALKAAGVDLPFV